MATHTDRSPPDGYFFGVGNTSEARSPSGARGKRLRICMVASSRFPIREPFAGGLEAHTYSFARELHHRGHRVSVFAAPGSDLGFPVGRLEVSPHRSSETARLDVAAPPARWMEEHHAYLSLMMSLTRAGTDEFDVVLNNSLHHLPVAMAAMLPMPLVTTLHTPPVPWLESAIEVAGGTGTFVAVSQAMSRAWAHAVPTSVILNGVDPDRWPAGPGGHGAVWSGRIVPEKAPHEAIDATRQTGRSITLVGPVLDQRYFERAIRPRLGPHVRYAGHVHQDRLGELVGSSAVAVVTPQWDEPYGLVAAEAMACGTPLAAYARGGLTEIVTPQTGRLAAGGDVEALAEAIDGAATCDRPAVRRHAVEAHGLARMVDEYEALFDATLLARAA
ncbi:MAG: glycosyltransferase [Propionibacteriales bacterium]|nr:glycosyltransferase [Propionibacteriales bacterium]